MDITPGEAVIYARISESRDLDTAGVDRQVAECRELVDRLGMTAVETYVDNNTSAWSGADRPQFQDLLRRVKTGNVNAVVAWAPDRLARNLSDYAQVMDVLTSTDTRLVTVQGGEVSMDAVGTLSSGVQALVSSYESNIKSARVTASARSRAMAGDPPGGPRKYGYTTDHRELVPAEADAIREAVDAILQGSSLRSQTKRLNEDPELWTPARKGRDGVVRRRPWQTTSLRTCLLRPALAGIVTYNGESYPDVAANWPAIITPAEHSALVAWAAGRRTGPNETGGRPAGHLLTSLAQCPCGGRMGTTTRTGPGGQPVLVYRCRYSAERQGRPGPHTARRVDLADALVAETVITRLERGDVQAALAANQGEDTERMVARRGAVQRDMAELADAVAAGTWTLAQAGKINRGLQDELAELDAKLEAADRSGALAVVGSIVDPRAWWESASLESRRSLVDALLEVKFKQGRRGGRFRPEDIELAWRV